MHNSEFQTIVGKLLGIYIDTGIRIDTEHEKRNCSEMKNATAVIFARMLSFNFADGFCSFLISLSDLCAFKIKTAS